MKDQAMHLVEGDYAWSTLPFARDAIAGQTVDPGRRRAVVERMQWITQLAERAIGSSTTSQDLRAKWHGYAKHLKRG